LNLRPIPADIRRRRTLLLGLSLVSFLSACTPTVQVVAPKEPITINLNIKLDADVRLRIEEKAKEDVGTKPIF
jgi:YnbE-like lipoprotein